jgi:threonine-phosphate decarboxylase
MINRIHGGTVQQPRRLPANGKWVDFSVNINPLGPAPEIRDVITGNLDMLMHYPEPESGQLRRQLAAFHNIAAQNLLIGNGSIEFIHLIPRALKVKRALIISPTFSEYEFAVRINQARPVFVNTKERDGFKIDSAEIKKFIPKVDLVFLCNPNNPTGFVMPLGDILELSDLCKRRNTVLLVDEVFMDFAEGNERVTMISQVRKNDFILVLRSLTKFFAIPGLRLGYLIGAENLIRKIAAFQYPWNVNTVAQIVASSVLKNRNYQRKSIRFILKEKGYLFNRLRKIKGLKVYYPGANFVFCKLEGSRVQSAGELSQKLILKGMVIRNCGNFRGLNQRFFRVAVRTRNQNNRLIKSLKDILE